METEASGSVKEIGNSELIVVPKGPPELLTPGELGVLENLVRWCFSPTRELTGSGWCTSLTSK